MKIGQWLELFRERENLPAGNRIRSRARRRILGTYGTRAILRRVITGVTKDEERNIVSKEIRFVACTTW